MGCDYSVDLRNKGGQTPKRITDEITKYGSIEKYLAWHLGTGFDIYYSPDKQEFKLSDGILLIYVSQDNKMNISDTEIVKWTDHLFKVVHKGDKSVWLSDIGPYSKENNMKSRREKNGVNIEFKESIGSVISDHKSGSIDDIKWNVAARGPFTYKTAQVSDYKMAFNALLNIVPISLTYYTIKSDDFTIGRDKDCFFVDKANKEIHGTTEAKELCKVQVGGPTGSCVCFALCTCLNISLIDLSDNPNCHYCHKAITFENLKFKNIDQKGKLTIDQLFNPGSYLSDP